MPPPVTHPCGTKAAYNRHRRRGEDPCDACRDANAAWSRQWRQRPRPLDAAVTISVYPTVAPGLSQLLGTQLEADGTPPYFWRRDYLADWDGAA